MKISAVIIAFNEQDKIAETIRSVSWADEVLLIDSESVDNTRKIASDLGAKVVVQPWLGFSAQKQFATDAAENDWVFSLDADERVSAELREEIIAIKTGSNRADGFRVPRLSFYMERPIRHGGWYPDRQLRLFDRRKGRWNDRLVHESFEMDNDSVVNNFEGEILHPTIDSAEQHHRLIGERYAPLAAKQMYMSGRRTSKIRVVTAGLVAFIRAFILKGGFLDGFPGFCIARFASHHAFLKHLMLWEMQKDGSSENR